MPPVAQAAKPLAALPSRTLTLAVAALIAVIGTWLQWRFGQGWTVRSAHTWGVDDAYITYRYALNLLNGYGPVFNPGEAAVEGYSNPLYLLAMVPLLAAFGSEHVYAASVVLNTLALIASLPLLARLGSRVLADRPQLAAMLPLFGAAFPPLWQAACSGLETIPVYTLQLAVVTLAAAPPARRAALLAALATAALTALRTDGFVIPVIVAAPLLLVAERRRVALAIVAAALATFGALTAWRLAYYGLPLPNVVYAKVHGEIVQRIAMALVQVLTTLPVTGIVPWMLLPLAGLGVVAGRLVNLRLKAAGDPLVIAIYVSLALTGYWLFVGGDDYRERFLLLVYPLGVVALFALTSSLRVAATAALVLNLMPLVFDARFAYGEKDYDLWIETGRFLGERHPGALLAIDGAGKVPFFSGLPIVDMLGLSDRHIASLQGVAFNKPGHDKRDVDYVFSRAPDLIGAWRNKDFELSWDLDSARYLAAGYCPRYLVYGETDRVAQPIIDLQPLTLAEWRAVPWKWSYVVLERRADCPLKD